jgi:hypothetical protein
MPLYAERSPVEKVIDTCAVFSFSFLGKTVKSAQFAQA